MYVYEFYVFELMDCAELYPRKSCFCVVY